MARPPKNRCVSADPAATVYKPRGIPLWMLEKQELGWDELEAVRLADLEGLYHEEAAMRMGISRATFGRVLSSARRKIADALLHGKSIVFQGGNITSSQARVFECEACAKTFEHPFGTGRPERCPHCEGEKLHRQVTDMDEQVELDGNERRRKSFRPRAEKAQQVSSSVAKMGNKRYGTSLISKKNTSNHD